MITKCRPNSLHPDAFQLDYRNKYKPQTPLCILFIELLVHLDQTNYVRLKVVKLQNSALYLLNYAAPLRH